MVDREAIRSNAKYLRGVRPLDPGEITEYVADRPHPGVVRRVLREEAYDLGIRERPDGSFVPVGDDPVPAREWAPGSFPDRHADALLDLLVERAGPDWHRGEHGDRLRETIRRLKADYHRRDPVAYDEAVALGYACYHLPDYYAAIGYVLDRIAERDLLPRRLRVLDVGAGVGGPALGLADYLPDDSVLDYHAVEPSAAADVLDRLLAETGPGVRTTIHRTTAESFDPDGPYDLVAFCNVLSELDDPESVVLDYLDAVAPDGSLVALAPADRHTSTHLRAVERAVAPPGSDVTVYAPTLRLWPGDAPADDCWSFEEGRELDAPPFQRRLDAAGPDDGTFRNTTVRFSYAVFRRDGARWADVRADPDRHARLAETERHVTARIDLLAVKLSHDLSTDEEANPVYLIGDGSQRTDHYAVLTRPSALNRALGAARYGAVLSFENALALWNEDEGAYNVVVDGETVVDRVA